MTADPPARRALGPFLAALVFFTRIRVGGAWDPESERRAACYAPLVGWIVGGVAAFAFAIASAAFPPGLAALFAVGAAVAITGALHEDGLADFCDGFGAGRDRETTLAVMRDSSVGVFAVLGVGFALAARCLALAAIASAESGDSVAAVGAVLVAGHALSRFVCVSFMFVQDYARAEPDAKGRGMSRRMSRRGLAFAGACGLAPVALPGVFGVPGAWLAIVPVAGAWLLLSEAYRTRLGGYTGDCLGAAQQISETIFYLGVCAAVYAVR